MPAARVSPLLWVVVAAAVLVDVVPAEAPRPEACATGRYLVRFDDYSAHDALSRRVDAAMAGVCSNGACRVAPRSGAKAVAPTDFVVVEAAGGGSLEMPMAIRKATGARSVTCDASISKASLLGARAPLAARPSNRMRGSAEARVPDKMGVEAAAWSRGYRGQGVRVAVFDTGLQGNHPHFVNIAERTCWTDEGLVEDNVGHGTFVAGMVGGVDERCPGVAPDVELHIYKVFTGREQSYTSWFLDAFNYAMHRRVDIINLSIGGPDYFDQPFVEKVWEVTARGILVVSAIGNDGPLWGTLNNPADQADVLGVGGVDYNKGLASFSSRGMTTWELPAGYGRVKPDVVAFSRVYGPRIDSGCRSLSGTSFASPVVAGVVALVASAIPPEQRARHLNPGALKQAVLEGAELLNGMGLFEQGRGLVDVRRSIDYILAYSPHVTAQPPSLDFTACPYTFPYCQTPLYTSRMPVIANFTLINGMDAHGTISSPPTWIEDTPSGLPGATGPLLDVQFSYSEHLWPYSGHVAVFLRAGEALRAFTGTVSGTVRLTVTSPAPGGGSVDSTVDIRITTRVIPTPPREKRVLWDQYHSIHYPAGFFPRDDLEKRAQLLDLHGDHPHTNFRELFDILVGRGRQVEVLGAPLTCFNASNYGTLIIVDPEDDYTRAETLKLEDDVRNRGLSLLVLADWFDIAAMKYAEFYDTNTRRRWEPITGGSNLPGLNSLLDPFHIGFGTRIFAGSFQIKKRNGYYSSGTSLTRFPKGGYLAAFDLKDLSESILVKAVSGGGHHSAPVLGMYSASGSNPGNIVAFGDSTCFDGATKALNCRWLVDPFMEFLEGGHIPELFAGVMGTALPGKVDFSSGVPLASVGNDEAELARVTRTSGLPPAGWGCPTPGGTLPIMIQDRSSVEHSHSNADTDVHGRYYSRSLPFNLAGRSPTAENATLMLGSILMCACGCILVCLIWNSRGWTRTGHPAGHEGRSHSGRMDAVTAVSPRPVIYRRTAVEMV